jgi:hypothetical protein
LARQQNSSHNLAFGSRHGTLVRRLSTISGPNGTRRTVMAASTRRQAAESRFSLTTARFRATTHSSSSESTSPTRHPVDLRLSSRSVLMAPRAVRLYTWGAQSCVWVTPRRRRWQVHRRSLMRRPRATTSR